MQLLRATEVCRLDTIDINSNSLYNLEMVTMVTHCLRVIHIIIRRAALSRPDVVDGNDEELVIDELRERYVHMVFLIE